MGEDCSEDDVVGVVDVDEFCLDDEGCSEAIVVGGCSVEDVGKGSSDEEADRCCSVGEEDGLTLSEGSSDGTGAC